MAFGSFTDSGQAALACRGAFADRFIHVAGVGWLEYDGRVWREVADKVPLAALRRWTNEAIAAELGKDEPSNLAQWTKRLDHPKLKNALALLQGFEEISVEPDRLDANPDLLNCRNGVVYLPTGDLTPHRPDLYLTKLANVDYDPTSLHEDWTAALAAIPADVQPWLQTRYGQAITGHMCPDDRVVIQQGGGSNGKSTVLAGVAGALGDYYHQASARILIGGQNNGATPEMADLRGTRFVAIEETPESGRLDVVGLKNVAGTTRISARKLYRDPVSFPASHTLFVNTNYPPQVAETDEGTWRRLLLVEFPYTFTATPSADTLDKPGDGSLRRRIVAGADQHRAVLAWLVEGAIRWYEARREFAATPAAVAAATEAWRWSTDHVEVFWEEFLIPDPNSYIWTGDLIWMFDQFMTNRGNSRVAESTFVRRFIGHRITTGVGVTRKKLRTGDRQTLSGSRPPASLDPHMRMPGAPTGPVWCWVGLRFAEVTDDGKPSLTSRDAVDWR